jgi:hypothetical protein
MISMWKSIPMEIWCFMAMCFQLNMYKQQFSRFIAKLFSKLTMANRQVRRRLSEDEMNRGIGMLEAGCSQRHIAHVLGVSQSVVSMMWNRFQITGNVLQGHAGGLERSSPG